MVFRRRRSVSQHQQPLSSPASQSAQSAASHAFLKSQTSTNSLSAAAAAAALRNRSPTPTNVENVQTKRMVQRTQSTQAPHNPLMGRSPSGRSASASAPLRRKGSSGSMSSRTFRDPSPIRPSTSSGPINHTPANVPPLPSLPQQYASRSRRPGNLEPSRGASPPTSPPRSPIRGVNTDRVGAGSPASHVRLNSLTTVPEQDRPESRGSVNFSYPRGARAISPGSADGWSANPKAAALREAALAKDSPKQPKSPEKSTATRPRAAAAANAEGSNASKQAGAAAGTALYAASQASNAQKNAPRPDPPAARADRVEPEPPVTSPRKEVVPEHKPEPKPAPPPLPRTPEIPETEPEQEPLPEAISPSQAAASRLSSVSPTIDHVEAVPTPRSSPLAPKESKQSRESSSPARSARFSKLLSVTGAGDQIHEPPGRSVSPAKSALKTARGSSLSPERKVAVTTHAQAPSEISDATSVASDEGSRLGSKKKQVKVSFDDEAEIVGVAASPPTSPEDYVPGSPPPGKAKSRMSWLGIGGKKKQSSDLGTGDDDFDEVLKPRPTLPSFGSVRGTRDGGPAPIPDFSDNESSSSSDEEISAPPVSFSGDHAIGNALPQLKESSQEALVTDDAKPVEESTPGDQHTPSSDAEPAAPAQSPTVGESDKLAMPAIAVEPATPPIGSNRKSAEFQQVNRSSMDQYQVPGGFPPPNSDRNSKSRVETPTPPTPPAGRVSFDDMDTEGEAESIYTDAPEDFDGDGFGSINAIVDGRPIPRSVTPTATEKEAHDVTPRPAEKAAEDIAELPGDDARASTPTQESVNRQLDEPIALPSNKVAQSDPQPPLPAKSKARAAQNGNIQADKSEQRSSIAVSGNADSSLQSPRRPRDTSTLAAGQGKPRPVSLGATASPRSPIEPFPSSLRRTTSNGSDSSSSFKRERAARSSRSGTHSMRRTMRSSASQSAVHLHDRVEPVAEYRPMSAGSGAGSGTLRKTLRGPGAPGAQPDRYSFFSTNKKAARTRSGRSPVKSLGETRFIHSDGEEDTGHGQMFSSRFADSSDEEAGNDDKLRPVRGIPRPRDAHDGDSTDLEDSSEEERRQTRIRQAPAVSPRKEPVRAPAQEKAAGPNMSGMAAVARQRGVTQRDLEEFVMRPPEGRKSFLSRIGLKKNKNADNRIRKADVESPSRIDTPLERSRLEREQVRSQGIPEDPYAHLATQSEPPSSPKQGRKLSKRHTIVGDPWPLRQARVETPEPVPENTQSASPQAQTQKAQAPAEHAERNGNVTVNGAGEAAPQDAESPKAAQTRPPVNRHDSLNSDDASIYSRDISDPGPARDVVIAGSGRKKRFPMLRKAFGLRS